jgi:hypothetical protein
VVGEEDEGFLLFLVPHLDSAEQIGALVQVSQEDRLVPRFSGRGNSAATA